MPDYWKLCKITRDYARLLEIILTFSLFSLCYTIVGVVFCLLHVTHSTIYPLGVECNCKLNMEMSKEKFAYGSKTA